MEIKDSEFYTETWLNPVLVENRAKNRELLDNYGKPRGEYISRLELMDDTAIRKETEQMIWLSAYAANNGRSDYHWQCEACYDELMRRTHNDDEYDRIHKSAFKIRCILYGDLGGTFRRKIINYGKPSSKTKAWIIACSWDLEMALKEERVLATHKGLNHRKTRVVSTRASRKLAKATKFSSKQRKANRNVHCEGRGKCKLIGNAEAFLSRHGFPYRKTYTGE